MVRVAFLSAVLAAVVLSAGCFFGGVYSKQDYGPPQVMMPPKDASVAELVKIYGAPDEKISSDNTTIFVYRKLEGMQVLGIFSQVKKADLVFVAKGDKIVESATVPKGEALTILGIFAAPVYGPGVIKEE